MGLERLNVYDGKTLYDLGMGTGKIVLQAFLQFRNLQYIHGVELSAGRFRIAEDATLRMIDMLGVNNFQIIHEPGQYLIVRERKENSPTSPRNMTKNPSSHLPTLSQTDLLLPTEEVDTMAKEHSMNELADYASASVTSDIFMKEVLNEEYGRVLHLACGNLFDTLPTIQHADVIMMETDVPTDLYPNLFNLFLQTKLHCRILSYLDFRRVFDGSIGTMTSVQTIPTTGSNATHALLSPQLSPAIHMIHQVVLSIHGPEMFLQQLDVNKTLADRYPTSWSVQRGHHFYLWVKVKQAFHLCFYFYFV